MKVLSVLIISLALVSLAMGNGDTDVNSAGHSEPSHSESHVKSGVVVNANTTVVNSTHEAVATVKSEVHNNVVSVTKGGIVKANAGFRLNSNTLMTVVPLVIALCI